MKVIKRDKTIEEFQIDKIDRAVDRAFESCGKEPNGKVVDCIKRRYDTRSDDEIHVEEIQDDVERCLMDIDKDVAKAYIIYRYNHKVIRENKEKIYKGLSKKLMADDVENQNANVDEHSFRWPNGRGFKTCHERLRSEVLHDKEVKK